MNRPGGGNGKSLVIFAAAIAGLLIFFACRNLWVWPVALRFPGEISEIEGRPMTEMAQLRAGVPIYAPASAEWYDSANYGPIYYWLGSRLVDLQHPGYRNLRVLSMAATLGCAVVCGLLAWSFARRRLAAVVAPVLFLGFSLVHVLAVTCRCDMMALFPVTAGFLLAYHLRSDRRILWACPLMVLGLGFKQIFIAAPAAILAYLVLEKRFRTAWQFATGCGLGFLALLLFFARVVYPGQAVLLHLFKYNMLAFSWPRLRFFLLVFAVTLLPAMIGALECLRRTRDRLMILYFGAAFAVAVVTVGKNGSSALYFVELVFVASSLLAGFLVSLLERRDTPSAVQLSALVAGSLLLTAWMRPTMRPADFANDAAIQGYLRGHFAAGTVALSEYAGDLTRAGLTTPIADLYQYSWLRCQGWIPRDELVSQVERRRFAAILVRTDVTNPDATRNAQEMCWTEDLRRGILENYRLDMTFRAPLPDRHLNYHAWVPR